MTMKCVCAWCEKVIRDGEEPITHGCCEECRQKFFGDSGDAKPDDDVTPDGFKGGQGRSGEELSEKSENLLNAVVFVILMATVVLVGLWGMTK